MDEIRRMAEAEAAQLIAWRRDFHQHPELALHEFRTADIIEAELHHLGIQTRRVGKTGIIGMLKGSQPGSRTIALRADIDALPVQEQSQAAYRSETDGVMHACGHDGHTACLLGAARILAAKRDNFGGEIRFLFQPAEEIGGGAVPMIDAGAIQGAERVFGLHAASDLLTGTVGLKPGLNNAAVDHFTIRVQGKSSHVAAPHLGVDALYIASQIVIAVQAIVTRLYSPVEPLVIGIGKLSAGTTYNALAEEAILEGTTRTISLETRAKVHKQIDNVAKSIAALYGGAVETQWEKFTSPLLNDAEATAEAAAVLEQLYGPGHAISDRPLSMSGDDFAEYELEVPGVYAYLGTGNPQKSGTQAAHHNGLFDIDEAALPIGAALYAGYALSWMDTE
ncbi:MAG: amidohydrolase [Oscillospiraceae bacterium]|nr:amidohydrolase [Oscillospiraceae bacterium]